jgi:hypothetical protein
LYKRPETCIALSHISIDIVYISHLNDILSPILILIFYTTIILLFNVFSLYSDKMNRVIH